jgi:hypothetical protein
LFCELVSLEVVFIPGGIEEGEGETELFSDGDIDDLGGYSEVVPPDQLWEFLVADSVCHLQSKKKQPNS